MIILIVAFAKENRVIGNKGKIPWHIKEDLLHFKNHTQNKNVLMGDATYLSLKNNYYKDKKMPYGKIYVATINKDLVFDDVEMVYDLKSFLSSYKDELYICGGATIYKLSLPYVDKAIISEIKGHYEGDCYFEKFEDDFDLVDVDERDMFDIKTYIRKK